MKRYTRKPLSEFQDFIASKGVEESEGIDLAVQKFANTTVQSVNFVHAPYKKVNQEFPGFSYSEYLLEIKLNPRIPVEQREETAEDLKRTIEFNTSTDLSSKNYVNIYGTEEETVVLIATGNAETLMKYLEDKNIVLDQTGSNVVKILHEDVWPQFKEKFKK